MPRTGAAPRKNGSTPSALGVAVTAPGQTLGRGVGAAATAARLSFGGGGHPAAPARSLGRGVGLAPPPRSRGRGGGSPAAVTTPPATAPFSIDGSCGGGFPSSLSGFPFPPSPCAIPFDDASGESSPGSWDTNLHPSGGFMSYFSNQPQNSHLVGGAMHRSPLFNNNAESSSPQADIGNDSVRTERRIMWTIDEDVRVMSAWIEHSTDSTVGADRAGGHYWGEVVDTYNKTTPPLRRRNQKQCKDRWHKINKWTDLFECAYVKARRVFTSGYNDQMWIDAAHKFYLDDNKDMVPPLGPYVLMEVWKICRDVPKWKTYNEDLKNARKRKTFHLEGDSQEDDKVPDEMPKRPMGQKAAKRAALAANGKLKGSSSSDDGQSKESPIDLDKFDRYSKFQKENNEKRMKLLDRQEKLSSEKLEATRIAHLTAQEYKEGKKLEKESKMMETYINLMSQDTSSMSAEEREQRVSMMKYLMKTLFPASD
ncbi:unnamed protein product [Urochloa decumbens]|uniref:Myb-like domain-containing protein n=1 Tax=Urochloa decumbens TaxID=240449 RepID=A0ABC9B4W8_9POAL